MGILPTALNTTIEPDFDGLFLKVATLRLWVHNTIAAYCACANSR